MEIWAVLEKQGLLFGETENLRHVVLTGGVAREGEVGDADKEGSDVLDGQVGTGLT